MSTIEGRAVMSSDDNLGLISTAYEAFARGDIPAVLDLLRDDCDWGVEASANIAPYYGIRNGASEVLEFFQALGATFEVERFEPTAMAANGDDVLAVVAYGIKSHATGRSGTMNIHHHFKVTDGKVTYFRGSEDTELVKGLLAGQ
jgi:ketosteroid isomerase-like protein